MYERNIPPYPGDGKPDPFAADRYFEHGRSANTIIPARFRTGRTTAGREEGDVPRQQDVRLAAEQERVEREARKLWLRMKREAGRELKEAGYELKEG